MDSGIHVTMERIAVVRHIIDAFACVGSTCLSSCRMTTNDHSHRDGNVAKVILLFRNGSDYDAMIFSDEQGVYYWHKGTGTVTRDRPESIVDSPSLTLSTSSSSNETSFESNSLLYKSESDTSIRVTSEPNEMHPCQARARVQTIADPKAQHRFHVCSLGWTTLHEEDLTSERSSRSVNRCIYELTRSIDDSVSRWGDGKDLYMDISHTDILLIDPMEMTIVDRQSIPAIRIWGVGRENSRFVSR